MTPDGPREIAGDAYVYAFPLVCMELVRRTATNVSAPSPNGRAPMNQFAHREAFADATSTDLVRPSADTISSAMWFDVAREPIVIALPDFGDRYAVFELHDMWTDVFASIGARTTGTSAQRITLASPTWAGDRAPGSELLRAPTTSGWIAGRIQAGGRGDLDAVHELQQAIHVAPLSAAAAPYTWPQGVVDSRMHPHGSTIDQIERTSSEQFFALFTDTLEGSLPHANDQPILVRMGRIGLAPGKRLLLAHAAPEIRDAIEAAGPAARERIKRAAARPAALFNGWRANLGTIGTYGTDYLRRAAVALAGLDASTPEDAVCFTAVNDGEGRPLLSESVYRLHFAADGLPPFRAFWSLTMYDHRQNLAANALDRYAVGSRDALARNADGSLDLFVQCRSPGDEHEPNWLPSPEHGPFSMTLRLHWPMHAVLDGQWQPPRIRRVS